VLEPDWYDYPYLANMARVAAMLVRTGRPARGLRLTGAVDQACNQRAFGVVGLWGDDHREVVDDAIRAMGARGRALYEGGRKMPIAEAKAYAIEDAPDDLLAAVRLTPREREVADFVRQGLTDGEIAATLGLFVRTVEGHVESCAGSLASIRGQASRLGGSQPALSDGMVGEHEKRPPDTCSSDGDLSQAQD
jgi:regulatory LuxR family protein